MHAYIHTYSTYILYIHAYIYSNGCERKLESLLFSRDNPPHLIANRYLTRIHTNIHTYIHTIILETFVEFLKNKRMYKSRLHTVRTYMFHFRDQISTKRLLLHCLSIHKRRQEHIFNCQSFLEYTCKHTYIH